MRGREAWLSAAGIFVVALVVRIAAAGVVVFPIPEDTAYYVGVARNLVEGRGLVSDALWSYSTPPLVLPRPAFEIWLPLPTLLIAPLMALAGATFRVAQALPVVVGALVPVLAWRLAADVADERGLARGRARTLALGVGLTASVGLPFVLHSTLPDSTMLFTALALGACILMARLARSSRATGWPPPADARPALVGLGVLLGLAALTRNEAIWLALTWVVVVWRMPPWTSVGEDASRPPARGAATSPPTDGATTTARASRLRLIGIPALVAILVFAPWAIRNTVVFGSPLPGQAISNALFVTGFDVFAYLDPPTLARYLAQGWPAIVQAHVDGFVHNLVNVLLIPSFPIGLIGLLALPWTAFPRRGGPGRDAGRDAGQDAGRDAGRDAGGAALTPLVLFSAITFLVTSLLFPVATTWGTFLHASGPVQVLLLVSCLLALDALIARVGVVRGWTRPVAWLGPTLTTAAAALFALAIVGFGQQSADIERRYTALTAQLARLGADAGRSGPIVADFPIWFAESQRAPALGLPDEPPENVVDLAERFGARYLVMSSDDRGSWPAVLASDAHDADCFRPVPLDTPADPADAKALETTRIWEIACP